MTAIRTIVFGLLTGVLVTPVPFQVGSATLSGRVVDQAGRPVRGATVKISAIAGAPTFFTGADGRFVFTDLPAGRIDLAATKQGYLDGVYGQRRPQSDGPGLEIRAGARLDNIELRIWQMGAISGRVVDEYGAPLAGVNVVAGSAREMAAGAWPISMSQAVTNDEGRYTIHALVPGEYIAGVWLQYHSRPGGVAARLHAIPPIVTHSDSARRAPLTREGAPTVSLRHPTDSVTLIGARLPPEIVRDGRRYGFISAWYPAAPLMSQAAPIAVGAGEERQGIDVMLSMRPVFEVSGRLIDPTQSGAATRMMLIGPNEIRTQAAADGSFVFPIVPSGVYDLRAMVDTSSMTRPPAGLVAGEGFWAKQTITIGDGDVPGVAVTLRQGLAVRGRIEFDGQRPDDENLRNIGGSLYADGETSTSASLTIAPNGTFVSSGFQPGAFTIRFHDLLSGWIAGEVLVQGRDHTDVPFEATGNVDGIVVRMQRPAAVGGRVVDERGSAAPFAAVVVFPADRSSWTSGPNSLLKTRRVRPNGGAYEIADLPPGGYLIAAVDDIELADWPQAAVLERIAPMAQSITLFAGARLDRSLVARLR